ncbi:Lipopolysaccharide export system ATP-binding protein LptB [Neolewinella maritima]|uniref:Lipopolysaccharide export system ATP-binding protein LptB n=1 Tax=Neolewinella maritima TaxID=1383882 RepID=A0ABM9B2G7_9BACT|nr:ATP-binding cassette domain-containing protein [Neolewinella maritima]CAH1001547.1 Lipopolysaccharide export system ATP-binding protein LptB [Neolewinella maritima]
MIRADSIRLSFGQREIIRDAVLHLREGEIVGLLGRNGAGKSCLYRILLGELKADYATIFVDGTYTKRPFAVPGLISYLPQRSVHPRTMRVRTLLSLYGLSPAKLLEDLPEFAERLDSRFANLSGGEARLLELVLVLSLPSRFKLLDEPFTELSPLGTARASALIVQAGRTQGILISDHRYGDMLAITERNYLLHDLRLVPFARWEDLIAMDYLPPTAAG